MNMLVGYMCVSSENEHQVFKLQYDALIQAGADPRNIYGSVTNRNTLVCSLSGYILFLLNVVRCLLPKA